MRLCFDVYDKDNSGFLSLEEIETLLIEMNLHKQFSKRADPVGAFDQFVKEIWKTFDQDEDGKISFHEFV